MSRQETKYKTWQRIKEIVQYVDIQGAGAGILDERSLPSYFYRRDKKRRTQLSCTFYVLQLFIEKVGQFLCCRTDRKRKQLINDYINEIVVMFKFSEIGSNLVTLTRSSFSNFVMWTTLTLSGAGRGGSAALLVAEFIWSNSCGLSIHNSLNST